MNIGWLCLSGIAKSETFLISTLTTLAQLGSIRAVSGASSGCTAHPNHSHLGFADYPLRFRHTLQRKLTGKNTYRVQLQERCHRLTHSVWNEFSPDFFWIEFGTTAVVAKTLLASQRVPYAIAIHGYDITREFRDEEYREQFVEIANASLCRGIICASEYTKRLCVLAGVKADQCKVIRLDVDGQKIHREANLQKTKSASFVHFGRLTEKKHPIATFEAFRRVHEQLPDAEMTFIGDGPLRSELERRVNQAKLRGHVRLLGAMDQSDALKEVQRHWVFVQHSVTAKSGDQEGFALSPAEAALMEMPVVSTLHNGIPEHVIEGKTGFLVREFDYESMADRMLGLATDSELRLKMGKEGRANILKMCDPEVRVSALREFLSSV